MLLVASLCMSALQVSGSSLAPIDLQYYLEVDHSILVLLASRPGATPGLVQLEKFIQDFETTFYPLTPSYCLQ